MTLLTGGERVERQAWGRMQAVDCLDARNTSFHSHGAVGAFGSTNCVLCTPSPDHHQVADGSQRLNAPTPKQDAGVDAERGVEQLLKQETEEGGGGGREQTIEPHPVGVFSTLRLQPSVVLLPLGRCTMDGSSSRRSRQFQVQVDTCAGCIGSWARGQWLGTNAHWRVIRIMQNP